MALDLTALADYVHENDEVLLSRSMFTSKTVELIADEGTLMVGVKTSEKVPILDTDAIFQDGTGCIRTPSGTTSITQRTVSVGFISVVEEICVSDLDKKYTSRKLKKGSNNNEIPFEKEYSDLKADRIAEQLEIAAWKGDTNSADANLSRFDGLVKIIDAAGGSVVQSNQTQYGIGVTPITTVTGITIANVKAIVNSVWLALPARIMGKDDVRIFCGWDTFNKFINAFTDQNLFNFAPTGKEVKQENGEVMIPGTTYRLTAVHGLDGTNRLFGVRMSNLVEATDLQNEEEQFFMKPDQFNNYLHFQVKFKLGFQVGFPDEVVSFKLV